MYALILLMLGVFVIPGVVQGQQGRQDERVPLEPTSWENHNPESLPERAIARLGPQRFRHYTSTAGHPKVVTSDGKLLITGGDQRICFWELPSGKFIYEFKHAYDHVSNIILSPDDRLLVVHYGSCMVFDVPARRMVREIGEKGAMPLCFSPDGKHLIAIEGKNLLWLSTVTWKEVKRWQLPEHIENVHAAQFIEQGTILQTRCWYPRKIFGYWNVTTGKLQEEHTIELPFQHRTASISKDGKYLVAAPYSTDSVKIYEIKTGKMVRELQGKLACSLYGLTFSPDGKTLLTNWFLDEVSQDGNKGFQISLWDFETGTLKKRFTVKNESDYTFLPDGQTLIMERGVLFNLYESQTGKQIFPETVPEHHNSVYSLEFSPDGQTLISGADNVIRWDVPHRKALQSYGKSYTYSPRLTRDGRTLIFTDGSREIRTIDVSTGQELHAISVPREDNWDIEPDFQPHFGAAHFAADGKSYWVMVTMNGYQKNGQPPVPGWSQWWQVALQTGKPIWKGSMLDQSHYSHVMRDGTTLVSIETGSISAIPGAIRIDSPMKTISANKPTNYCVIYDLKTLRRHSVFTLPDRIAGQIADSPRGNSLLTCCSIECGKNDQGWNREEYTMYLWEPTIGKRRLTIQLREQSVLHWFLGQLLFSPDARRIAGFRIDGVMMMWDAITGELLWEQATKLSKVRSAAFSADGTTLATGHEDSTIVLWNVGDLVKKSSPLKAGNAELEAWWNQLGENDSVKAYQAIWKMADAGLPAAKYIQERVKPIPPIDTTEVARWIEQLDSKSFAERNEASQHLAQVGNQGEAMIQQALQRRPSPETRKRLEQIWNQHPVPSQESMQLLRSLEVLEHQGTEEARNVVTVISKGDPTHLVTQRAKVILYRWHEQHQ